jgi:predicted permease
MDTVLHDIRYAIRMLRKAPGATTVAIASLALGIAINTTVFGWVRGILLNPLPGVADPDRVVTIETIAPSGTMIDSSFADYQTFRDQATLLSGAIAFKERPVGIGTDRSAERAWAMMVTGNYFDVLGVKPALGRFFEAAEQSDTPDAHPVAVLGYAMWQARFSGDPAVVGRTVFLNKQPYSIIGVAPDGFFGTITGLRFDLFVPLTMQASLTGASPGWRTNRRNRPLYLFARLKPGVTIEQAQTEITRIAATAAAELPDSNLGISARLLPATRARRGAQHDLGPLLQILFAVGVIVLLIVCANVANLQFARATARGRELAVRLGLGASRGTIVRQLFTEGVVLGAVSCAFGVLASAWLIDSLRLLLPFSEYPLVLPAAIGGRELLFAVAASMIASLLFALAPALRSAAAGGTVTAMNAGRQTEAPHTSRVGAALVVGQVALTMAALAGAGLLLRSFDNARRADPGFNARNVLLAGLNLSTAGYNRADALQYLDRVAAAVQPLPGVRQVAFSEDVPLGFNGGAWEDLSIDGYVPRPSESMKIYRNLVGPGYFDLMGIRLMAGRDFTDLDTRETAFVAIVNQTFARRYFGSAVAVGRRFTGWGRPITIVGIVADSKYHALSEPAEPYLYMPLRQLFTASTGVALHVRTAGAPLALAPAVRDAMRDLDPAVPTDLVTTLAAYTSAAYYAQRLAASLLTVLGSMALILSAIGLYSLMAYGVARRRREIGVRIALGATGSSILGLVMGRGLALVAAGIVGGTVLALTAARALSSLLFGVGPMDAAALAGAIGLLTAIACLASYLPARAAARVDPIQALRAD